jgi:hypothetical protein
LPFFEIIDLRHSPLAGGAMGFVMGIFFSSLGGPSSMGMPDVEVAPLAFVVELYVLDGPLLTVATDEGRVEEANGRAFQAHGPKWRVHDEGDASSTAHPLLREVAPFSDLSAHHLL